MVKIQYIGANKSKFSDPCIFHASFSDSMSPDLFDVNVIDLSNESLWKNENNSTNSINIIEDLVTLNSNIENSSKSRFLFLLPGNVDYYYNFSVRNYLKSVPLRTRPSIIGSVFFNSFNSLADFFRGICFEQNFILHGQTLIHSSFIFVDSDDFKNKVYSSQSEKLIGFSPFNNIHLTFAQIKTFDELNFYLEKIEFAKLEEPAPEWFKNVCLLNDSKLIDEKNKAEEAIKEYEDKLFSINSQLKANKEIESCLYKQGDELVRTIFPLIEKVFSVTLENFIDLKKEDFNFLFRDLILVGEIKGVSSNVKNKHISQAEYHKTTYIDDNQIEQSFDKSKIIPVLIINHQLDKPLAEREPINEEQVNYAKLQGVIVLETFELIKMYYLITLGKLSLDDVYDIICKNVGKIIKIDYKTS